MDETLTCTVPVIFEQHHGFDLLQNGLAFLGLFVGMLSGIFSDPLFQIYNRRLIRQREEAGGEPGGTEPEMRLPPTVVGVWFVVVGLFGFGWSSYSFVHWIVPIFFSGFFGVGIGMLQRLGDTITLTLTYVFSPLLHRYLYIPGGVIPALRCKCTGGKLFCPKCFRRWLSTVRCTNVSEAWRSVGHDYPGVHSACACPFPLHLL